jgi:anthranilate synthase component 2
MLLLIDNYDSFTFNLYHFLGDLGVIAEVHRNDALTVQEAMAMRPQAIVLSPGPCDPDRAGICLGLINAAAQARTPLFGVCLGEQALGQAMGGKVVRAPAPMHGKISSVKHDGTGVFEGVPSPINVTRYHSLTVERASLPKSLRITAETDDGVIMGLAHRELPLHGVQFHPESIASQHGHDILANFLRIAGYKPKAFAGKPIAA